MQRTLLSNLLKRNPKAVFIGSLGTISYDLEDLMEKEHFPNDLYLVRGAMGCALSIGLGYALSSRDKVIVVIGDGSFLMKMGSIAAILKYRPKNLEVHILENGKYLSTGGQSINFKEIKRYIPKIFKIHAIH